MDWEAIALSIRLAACTVGVLLVVGAPLGYWIAHGRSRFKAIVQTLVATPLVLPPTVLGLCLLVALGPRSPVGAWVESVTGHRMVFSFSGLLIASIISSLPFMVHPLALAFASIERELIEISWCQGASRRATMTHVVLPLALPGIIAGSALAFAHTMGEFGVVLMVGGNIPGRTRTASVAIYDAVQTLEYRRAALTAAALVGVAVAALLASFSLQRRLSAGIAR